MGIGELNISRVRRRFHVESACQANFPNLKSKQPLNPDLPTRLVWVINSSKSELRLRWEQSSKVSSWPPHGWSLLHCAVRPECRHGHIQGNQLYLPHGISYQPKISPPKSSPSSFLNASRNKFNKSTLCTEWKAEGLSNGEACCPTLFEEVDKNSDLHRRSRCRYGWASYVSWKG